MQSVIQMPNDTIQNDPVKQAQRNFKRGCELLCQAESEGFSEEAMVRAYKHLSKAVRQNPQAPDYQAELGYFYLLLDNRIQAEVAIYRALELNPEHSRALELALGLDSLKELTPDQLWFAEFQAFEALRITENFSVIQFDQLYDDIESFVQKQVQMQLKRAPILQANLDDTAFQQQLQWLEEYDYVYPILQAKIALLDQEFDTSELYYLLEPLSKMSQQIRRCSERVIRLFAIQEGIEAGLELLQTLLVQMNQEQGLSDETQSSLNELYDMADQLADILDQRENDSESQFLLKHYEQFIVQVNVLQERIDELS